MLLLLFWHGAAVFAASRFFPGPAAVARAIAAEVADGEMLHHLGITLRRVGISFVISMVVGSGIGMALGRLPLVDRLAHPWVVVLLNVPALVVIILCYLWLGLTETALLAAVALNKIPQVAIGIREGARQLDADLAEMARLYRFGLGRTWRDVLIPQLAPYLAAAARNGLALIWKIVLVVELIGRPDGVGFKLQTYFELFDITRVLAYSTAFLGCILLVELVVFGPLDRRLVRWRR